MAARQIGGQLGIHGRSFLGRQLGGQLGVALLGGLGGLGGQLGIHGRIAALMAARQIGGQLGCSCQSIFLEGRARGGRRPIPSSVKF